MLVHLLPQGRRGGFKVYGFDFALLGPRERSVKFCGCSIAGLFRFLLSFVLTCIVVDVKVR